MHDPISYGEWLSKQRAEWQQKPLTAQEELHGLVREREGLERRHRDAMASLEGKIREARAHAGSNPEGPALGLTKPKVRL